MKATEVIKALRTGVDDGTKIDVATSAWNDSTLALPRKADVLLEFCLDRLLKGRTEHGPAAPLPNINYWLLLVDLSKASNDSLPTLLTRIPTVPILTSLFDEPTLSPDIPPLALTIFGRLLPIAVRRATTDVTLDCTRAAFTAIHSTLAKQVALRDLVRLFLREAEVALQAGGPNARKKSFTHFVQHCLPQLLRFLAADLTVSPLRTSLCNTAQAALFSLTILQKNILPPGLLDAISAVLEDLPAGEYPDIVLQSAFQLVKVSITFADILKIYISGLRKHGEMLFPLSSRHGSHIGESSRSASEVHQLSQTRSAAFALYAALLARTEKKAVSSALQQMVAVIKAESMYLPNAVDGALANLRQTARLGLTDFNVHCVHLFTDLLSLDFDAIREALPALLSHLLQSGGQGGEADRIFVNRLLEYYSKTRQLPAYLDMLYAALANATPLETAYASPLADSTALHRELRTSAGQPQVLPMLENRIGHFVSSLSADNDGLEEGPMRKKRRLSSEQRHASPQLASSFVASCAVEALTISVGDRDAAITFLESVVRNGHCSSLLEPLSAKRKPASSQQITCVAALRLLRAIWNRLIRMGYRPAAPPVTETHMDCLVDLIHRRQSKAKGELIIEVTALLFSIVEFLDDARRDKFFDALIGILDSPAADEWDGSIYGLSPLCTPIAAWKLLCHHIGSLDRLANPSHLEHVARLLLSVPPLTTAALPQTSITIAGIAQSLFSSAEFYELPRLRGAILDRLAHMKQFDRSTWERLKVMPMQYFPLANRRDLVVAALTFDSSSKAEQDLLAARQFLLLAFRSDKASRNLFDTRILLQMLDERASANADQLADISIELFADIFDYMVKNKIDVADLLKGILGGASTLSSLGMQALCAAFEICVAQTKYISPTQRAELAPIVDQAIDRIRLRLRDFNALDSGNDGILALRSCRCVLAAAFWTESTSPRKVELVTWRSQQLRLALAGTQISKGTHCDAMADALLRMLSDCVRSSTESALYEAFLAVFLHLGTQLQRANACDGIFQQTFKHISSAGYLSCSTALEDRLARASDNATTIPALRAARLLLECNPEGTGSVAADWTSRLLRIVACQCQGDPPLPLVAAAADVLTSVCTERALALDCSEAACLITTFAVVHRLDQSHTQNIASSASRLLHARTDLVLSLLPMFCHLASQMMCCCSSGQVENAADEAVGRLLYAMGSSKRLAGGLKKHALFVLLPWLRAGSPGRASLGPKTGGLNALLGALGPHERDSLLGGYLEKDEEPERIAFKAMMRDYERTRYKGEA